MSDLLLHSITAPYNFVPLSAYVYSPEWQDQVSHDIPLLEGISGTLQLHIQTYTPLLIGTSNDEGNEIRPFRLPDGKLAIPGSSLRGMIRNVLEIASFGKMRLVDDQRFGVRDLQAPFYQKQLTQKSAHKNYKPLSKAGWLRFEDDTWSITPCEYARIEQNKPRFGTCLKDWQPSPWASVLLGKRPEAELKYSRWKKNGGTLNVKFEADEADFHPHNRGNQLYYAAVTKLGSGSFQGQLVFTGQPGPQKHMEFIFHHQEKQSFSVPDNIMRDFLHIYSESKHWQYLQKNHFPLGIPVFYLENNNSQIKSLGLSQMYRIAYKNSIHDLIKQRNTSHTDNNCRDLAELIFGTVDEDQGTDSLKGRVSFSHAICTSDAETEKRPEETILSSPKPTFYPNYIVQDHNKGKLIGNEFKTYEEDKAVIRGWKRYPVRPLEQVDVPTLDQEQRKSGAWVKLYPIKNNLKFSGKLRFHNLHPLELGALVWLLNWGNNDQLRHNIGMGKPFGYGQLSISIKETKSTLLANNKENYPSLSLQDYRLQFQQHMDKVVKTSLHVPSKTWLDTPQIQQLMAMADPQQAPGQVKKLKHLDLQGENGNQFVLAKGGRKNPKLVLQDYIPHQKKQSAQQTVESKWLSEKRQQLAKIAKDTPEKMLGTKGLAQAWQEIEDNSLKAAVRNLIKTEWIDNDWWEKPNGKSKKHARAIYGDDQ